MKGEMPVRFRSMMILSLIIVLAVTINARGQFTGYGDDQRYQASVLLKPVNMLPPIEQDMPQTCQKAYMMIDALSLNSTCSYLQDYLRYSPLDTLKYYASYLYEIVDYSPSLFTSYEETLGQKLKNNDKYKSTPECLLFSTVSAIKNQYMNTFGKDFSFLLMSHYILKIRVDSVVAGIDTTSQSPLNWINVSCSVLERIKGKMLPQNCKIPGDESQNLYQQITGINNCLNFGYIEDWETGTGFDNSPTNARGALKKVHKGQVFYAFLKHVSENNGFDIITPELRFEISGGLFLINGDKIYDPSNFWGLGNYCNELDFRNQIFSKIDTLKDWGGLKVAVEDDESISSDISIRPNPASGDYLFIQLSGEKIDSPDITIYNLNGSRVSALAESQVDAGTNIIPVNISSLIPGVYYVSIRLNGSIKNIPFTVYR
jgi:hypothetical protein